MKPMLAHTCPPDPDVPTRPMFPPNSEWVMQPKLDGWRFLFQSSADLGDDRIRCFAGRNGSERSDSPALKVACRILRACLPVDSIVDAEVIVPGGSSGDVSSALASGARVEVWLFDILRLDGQDTTRLTFGQRNHILSQVDVDGHVVRLTPSYGSDPTVYDAFMNAGLEGAVFKRADGIYREGARSRDTLKFKPQPTAEATIIGYIPGKGEREGTIGALKIRLVDSGVETSVGIPIGLSTEILAAPDDYLDRHIEFAHNGIQPSGSPRHPVFRCLRPDRDAVENAWGMS
jgi:bifunctional non-homologous end joining protein LigD